MDIFGRKRRKEQKEKVKKAVKYMLTDHDLLDDSLSDEERYIRHVQNILRMQAEEERERMKS